MDCNCFFEYILLIGKLCLLTWIFIGTYVCLRYLLNLCYNDFMRRIILSILIIVFILLAGYAVYEHGLYWNIKTPQERLAFKVAIGIFLLPFVLYILHYLYLEDTRVKREKLDQKLKQEDREYEETQRLKHIQEDREYRRKEQRRRNIRERIYKK